MTTKGKMTKQEILSGLSHCIGTEKYWSDWMLNFNYTDGIKYMVESCNSYWLLTAIASHRRNEPFQVWDLKVDGSKAVLTMKEDSELPVVVKQKITYTDFPLDEMTVWVVDGIMLLPSEY